MLPFIYNFTTSPIAGLHWLDFGDRLDGPHAVALLAQFRLYSPFLAFGAVAALFWKIWRSEIRPMPLIGALILITNGVWWFVFQPMRTFVWATIFHGIQYLAIVTTFHVKD